MKASSRVSVPYQDEGAAPSPPALHADFHPIIGQWFKDRFGSPTPPQARAWPTILAGKDTLIAAPTGSGKTLAAFLVCIDRLLRDALAGTLKDATRVLYISPLKALSNDVRRNLEGPLAEILEYARRAGYHIPDAQAIRTLVRTGDTPASARQAMLKRPPHILVTTPESIYLLLTSEKSQNLLKTVDTLIVDEIHALARDKRGSHLSLSLARLDRLIEDARIDAADVKETKATKESPATTEAPAAEKNRPVRIGLSATQKPLEDVAAFLVGQDEPTKFKPCVIVDSGHHRQLDLGVEVPTSELSAVCSNEQWEEIYARLTQLIATHRSTLIFVNTRKLAERVAFNLRQQLGEESVASHHGSLSRERRLDAEERLKRGELKAIVATASLELGIDIGFIDLVCQIGSPRSIATFLQRIGRSGHAIGVIPKGRLFALTRDELMESLALIKAVKDGALDKITIPKAPLDILAQQIVAAAASRHWREDELYQVITRAFPYKELQRDVFDEVITMLSQGYAQDRNRTAYLHRDVLNREIKARRHARLTALTSGGAIPEQAEYRVITVDEGSFVGTVNEDFAVESAKGDVFLLGNTSWMVVHVRGGEVIVRDANGAPPSVPFWLGEAPGRSLELSQAVSEFRAELAEKIALDLSPDDPLAALESLAVIDQLDPPAYRPARDWLDAAIDHNAWANLQAVHYVSVQKAAVGLIPSQKQVIFERFFDDTGGMQLVIHAPFGLRINRGWGLALRKRFCRSFDFELQASADNEGIVLSLGPQHSFPIEQLFRMLNPRNIRALLEQALLAVPLFQIRWRWNTTRALAVLRSRGGKRIPPALQRFNADDLLSAVFPAQTQCQENVTGDIEIPSHPLVRQTMHDCLNEAIDIDGLIDVMDRIEKGEIKLIARDTREPSPFSYQLLNANPYAFLDGAPLEERRARAVATRRTLSIESLRDLGQLDPEAIEQVRREAWPLIRSADELHDALVNMGVLPEDDCSANLDQRAEGKDWRAFFKELVKAGRAGLVSVKIDADTATHAKGIKRFWYAAENLSLLRAAYETCAFTPELTIPSHLERAWTLEEGRSELIRGYIECRGVVTVEEIAGALALPLGAVEATLPASEGRGEIMRGHFLATTAATQWCNRRLLIRIHRLTLEGLRRQIKPVTAAEFYQFLFYHQGLLPNSGTDSQTRSSDHLEALSEVITQLQGFEAAAGAWEQEILCSRLAGYQPHWLDELTHAGVLSWGRLQPPARDSQDSQVCQDSQSCQESRSSAAFGMNRVVPVALLVRENLAWLLPKERSDSQQLLASASGNAESVYQTLAGHGAQFFDELRHRTALLPTQLEDSLGELARLGLISADGFAAIRPFVNKDKKKSWSTRRGLPKRFQLTPSYSGGGRWTLFPGATVPDCDDEMRCERWAQLLLLRYGVIFRDLLARETAAPPWGQLAPLLRRLEAQGEIRGGRFVSGVYGEQFALPGAVEKLRELREKAERGRWVVISAADPLNLIGVLTPGNRLSSLRAARFVVRDGEVVAIWQHDAVEFVGASELSLEIRNEMANALRLNGVTRARLRHTDGARRLS